MFLLQLLPTSMLIYFVNLIFYTGVACTLFGFVFRFKFFEQWRLIIQVVGVMALGVGLYMKGGYEVEQQWRAKAAAFQQKVDIAAEQSKTANAEVQTKIVTKLKVIHDTKVVTKQVLKEVATTIDAECRVTPDAIKVLNQAASRPKLDLSIPQGVEIK